MTDAYALTLAGLPGIALRVRAPGYLEQAHSAEDTLDEVSPADLRQAVTELANGQLFPRGCTCHSAGTFHLNPNRVRAGTVQNRSSRPNSSDCGAFERPIPGGLSAVAVIADGSRSHAEKGPRRLIPRPWSSPDRH
jgi:hypothetical protein